MIHADATPYLGTLITADGLQFRVTIRCLREDLDLGGPVDFAQLLEGPVGSTLAGRTGGDSEDASLSRPASTLGSGPSRLLLHPSGTDGVLWVVACGLGSDRWTTLDTDGRLWPSNRDRDWLADDRLVMRMRLLQVEAPMALAQAQQQPGELCEIGGLAPDQLVQVAVHPETGELYAAITIPQAEDLTVESARRRIAVTLAAIRAESVWTPVDDDLDTESQDLVQRTLAAESHAPRLVFHCGSAVNHASPRLPAIATRELTRTTFQLKNIAAMRRALEHHASECPEPVVAFLLNPVDFMVLKLDELWGIRVAPDDNVEVKRLTVQCLGDRHRIETALDTFINEATGRASA